MRPRGGGSVFRSKWKDKKSGELRQSRFWSIRYFVNGKMFNESSGSKLKRDAERMLRGRLDEVSAGNPDPSASASTTFEELARLLVNDYVVNDRKSTVRVERSIGHLRRFFDNRLSHSITPASVIEYTSQRKSSGAANATINRELAALKRAFRLGKKSSLVVHVPAIDLLVERNRRTGFFEHDEYQAVLAELPAEIQPIVVVAYITGWRVNSEVLTRQWRHIDFNGRRMRLDADETKNDEPRVSPSFPSSSRCYLSNETVRQPSSAPSNAVSRGSFIATERESNPSAGHGSRRALRPAYPDASSTTSGEPPFATSSAPVFPALSPWRWSDIKPSLSIVAMR